MKYRIEQKPMAGGESNYYPQYSRFGIFWSYFPAPMYENNRAVFTTLAEANRFLNDQTHKKDMLKREEKVTAANKAKTRPTHHDYVPDV